MCYIALVFENTNLKYLLSLRNIFGTGVSNSVSWELVCYLDLIKSLIEISISIDNLFAILFKIHNFTMFVLKTKNFRYGISLQALLWSLIYILLFHILIVLFSKVIYIFYIYTYFWIGNDIFEGSFNVYVICKTTFFFIMDHRKNIVPSLIYGHTILIFIKVQQYKIPL